MSNDSVRPSRFSFFRRLWKPAFVTGAGGTAIVIWFEEAMAFGEEILAMISVSIMAGIVYLLDIFMFKSRTPRREDKENLDDGGMN